MAKREKLSAQKKQPLLALQNIFTIKGFLAIGIFCGVLYSFIFSKDVKINDEQQRTALIEVNKTFEKIILPKIPVHSLVRKFAKDDHYFQRWLKGASYDANIAATNLKQHLEWREAEKIDKINEENWSQILNKYPVFLDTFDKSGRPVAEVPFGKWNFQEGIANGEYEMILRTFILKLEMLTRKLYEAKSSGKNVETVVELLDMSGFGIRKHFPISSLPLYYKYTRIYISHYAGLFSESININAPKLCRISLHIIEPLFGESLKNVIKSYGENDDWMTAMDSVVAKSQRSTFFGGTIQRKMLE